MKNLKIRVLKNCFESIRIIQHANNMLEIASAIDAAMADVYKCRNRGIYIALATDKEAERTKFANREQLTEANKKEVKNILIAYVPARLHTTIMYKCLLN